MKNKAEKKAHADQLRTQLATVSTVILSTFTGINAEDDTKLRRAIENCRRPLRSGQEHRLPSTPAEGTPAESLLKGLTGPNSISYTMTAR